MVEQEALPLKQEKEKAQIGNGSASYLDRQLRSVAPSAGSGQALRTAGKFPALQSSSPLLTTGTVL